MASVTQELLLELKDGLLDNAKTEALVAALRPALLREVLAGAAVSLELLSVLASFCLACEYVLNEESEETALLAKLNPEGVIAHRLMLACYRPILDEDRDLASDEIAELRPISNDVSRAVQAQYEENPYPRWRRLPVGEAATDEWRHVLVAGCGTGRDVLSYALLEPRSTFVGLDLSRASLSYALARSREFEITNVRFVRGDMLDVALLGQKFDLVISSGVLHHMQDPAAGLTALGAVLKPNGTMRIAVYSKTARARA